jgi:hypothetical protein
MNVIKLGVKRPWGARNFGRGRDAVMFHQTCFRRQFTVDHPAEREHIGNTPAESSEAPVPPGAIRELDASYEP